MRVISGVSDADRHFMSEKRVISASIAGSRETRRPRASPGDGMSPAGSRGGSATGWIAELKLTSPNSQHER